MKHTLPGWSEFVYDNYNALGFGFSPTDRPSDAVFSIVLYPRWVRLFFLQDGPSLDDPEKLLSGNGRQVRSLVLQTADDLDTPAVKALLKQAMAGHPRPATSKSTTTIRSISANQRPRRPPPRL